MCAKKKPQKRKKVEGASSLQKTWEEPFSILSKGQENLELLATAF